MGECCALHSPGPSFGRASVEGLWVERGWGGGEAETRLMDASRPSVDRA